MRVNLFLISIFSSNIAYLFETIFVPYFLSKAILTAKLYASIINCLQDLTYNFYIVSYYKMLKIKIIYSKYNYLKYIFS